jgi:hypothetical protein
MASNRTPTQLTLLRARNFRRFRRKLAVARAKLLANPVLKFNDPPALVIDRFIDVLLGGDGSNPFPDDNTQA